MHGRFLALSAIAATLALAGCNTIRHDNLLLFGTDTTFGLSAGTTATNVAQASVGYRRQEAVVMPLVANYADTQNQLVPCDVAHQSECKLVAQNDEHLRDSYSVVATFGAKFDTNGSETTAGGGLAQTFATGAAAQILALKGGAALVSTGEAAQASARNDVSTELAALVGDADIVSAGNALATQRNSRRVQVSSYLLGKSDADLPGAMEALSQSALNEAHKSFLHDRCQAANLGNRDCAIRIAAAGRNPIISDELIDDFYAAYETASKPAETH